MPNFTQRIKTFMSKQVNDCKVLLNRPYSADYYCLVLKPPVQLPEILPGQFVQVLIEGSQSTYLRRPISVYEVDSENNTFSLLIKKLGEGTRHLSGIKEGDLLNVIYPLGNSFTMPEKGKVLLVGGGVGMAPMLMLASQINNPNVEIDIIVGGRTAEDIIAPEKFEKFGNLFITTNDGSLGENGFVTQHSVFESGVSKYSRIYACGPDVMMKAVARLAVKENVSCEVSLENLMACGIGACLCCIAETTSGNKTSCVEGPVFNVNELINWL